MCQDDRCEQVTLHLVSTDRCWWMQLVCAPRRSTRPLRLLQRKRSCLSGSGGPRVVSDDARRFYVTPCVSRRWSVFCILESEARRRGLERTYNVVRCLVSVCRVSGIWVRADVYGRCGVHTQCLSVWVSNPLTSVSGMLLMLCSASGIPASGRHLVRRLRAAAGAWCWWTPDLDLVSGVGRVVIPSYFFGHTHTSVEFTPSTRLATPLHVHDRHRQ